MGVNSRTVKSRFSLRFTGRVQGVGFRWTAQQLANSLGLTGWVYNDWDGSVQMEVQGRPESIKKLIEGLDRGTFIQIDNLEKKEIPIIDYERTFKIKDY